MRAFLAMRILGVIPAARLQASDLILVLAKLAESQDTCASLETFAHVDAVAPYQVARHDEPDHLLPVRLPQ
jgi:hypothetical protein